MLDNDIIRLRSKLDAVIQLQEKDILINFIRLRILNQYLIQNFLVGGFYEFIKTHFHLQKLEIIKTI